jgi:predicted Fe-S protein YdhL (DUF1289 family)
MKKLPIESPCISVCRYENEVCVGCGRTVDEIVNWYDMTDDEKQAVLNRLEKDSKGWFK